MSTQDFLRYRAVPVVWYRIHRTTVPRQYERSAHGRPVPACGVQKPRVGKDQGAGFDRYVDLFGIVPEHNRMVVFDESRALFVRRYKLVVQRYAPVVRARDHLETAVLDRRVGQVVVQEDRLRPR